MKGIFQRLFGGRNDAGEAAPGDAEEYNGFRIRPAPFAAEGQWQTAGLIEKDFPDGRKEHRFIRAEKHASREEAAAFSTSKAKQIIDQSGDAMFEAR